MSESKERIRRSIPTPNFYRQLIYHLLDVNTTRGKLFRGKGKIREKESYKKMKVQAFVTNKNQQLQLQMYHKLFSAITRVLRWPIYLKDLRKTERVYYQTDPNP